jgi:hypothetical protein
MLKCRVNLQTHDIRFLAPRHFIAKHMKAKGLRLCGTRYAYIIDPTQER